MTSKQSNFATREHNYVGGLHQNSLSLILQSRSIVELDYIEPENFSIIFEKLVCKYVEHKNRQNHSENVFQDLRRSQIVH